jgi:hypothetical protein
LRRKFCASGPIGKRNGAFELWNSALKTEVQEENRYRFWGRIEELEGGVLRVITLEDKITIHNAFPERGFKS